MASAAPPVRFPNVYGIDMPTKEELIAHDRSIRRSASSSAPTR
jgi:amidophosphoribosyltransferase